MSRAFLQFAALWAISCVAAGAEKGGVYLLRSYEGNIIGSGTCVAIDVPDKLKRQHFLTVKHNVTADMEVESGGKSFAVELVAEWVCHPEPIVLLRQVRSEGQWKEYRLATSNAERGQIAFIAGFPGGRFRGVRTSIDFVDYLSDSYLYLRGVSQSGMSGGAILSESGHLVGLVTGADDQRRQTYAVNVWDAVQRNRKAKGTPVQWRCYRGRCYPMYVQPMFPSVVSRPVQPQPVITQPAPRPASQTPPQVDMEEVLRDVKIEVVAWLEENREQLRGEDGADGEDGASPKLNLDELADVITSKYGDRIRGKNGEGISPGILSKINSRLSVLEQGQRVLVVDGNNVLDDETYKPGEAIVLDVQRLVKQAKSK